MLYVANGGVTKNLAIAHQSAIENVLDMWLSTSELEKLAEGWKAFCENPYLYKDSVVVDMVRESILSDRKE